MSNQSFKRKFSNKIFNKIKTSMPPISQTERDAIEAGDTWLDGDIFKGNINWKEIFNNEKNKLSDKEVKFIEEKVIPLIKEIDDYKITEEQKITDDILEYLKKEKFLSMIIPESYGGLEFSALANSTIVGMIASVSCAVAVTVMVPNSLGPGELLMKYGTEEQKDKWLPRLSNGDEVPCFGLTSPKAGSDAGAIPDIGVVVEKEIDGKKVLGINLNFEKRYITLAPIATLLGLAFKLKDPDNLLGEDKEDYGITCALIPMDTQGVDNSYKHRPMDVAFWNGAPRGKDVFIPIDSIIGGRKNAGKGWRMLVECLSAGRGISLPALAAATSQTSYRMTSAYAQLREQFGLNINKFEGVQEALARIGGYTYIIEATRQMTAEGLDKGFHPSVITAITKYHTTELARETVKDGMDILAGKAIIQGPKNFMRNAYQGMPIAITVEGANILTRSLMIFGQGSIRCHPYLLEEMELLNSDNEEEAKEKFESVLFKHMKYTTKNSFNSFFKGLTLSKTGKTYSGLNKKLKSRAKKIEHMSKVLSSISDISLLTLGGSLKMKEYLSARLGDLLSYNYMALSVIRLAEKQNHLGAITHAEWALDYLLNKMSVSFKEFCDNFPSKSLGCFMKFYNYPLGIHYKVPSYKLSKDLVKLMTEDSDFRDTITSLCFTEGNNNPLNEVEVAYKKHYENIFIHNKVKEILSNDNHKYMKKMDKQEFYDHLLKNNMISKEDYDKLLIEEELRMNVINVDVFKV